MSHRNPIRQYAKIPPVPLPLVVAQLKSEHRIKVIRERAGFEDLRRLALHPQRTNLQPNSLQSKSLPQ